MNILLLGSGGREDALAWRLRQSPSCDKLIAAPGNPGIARWADLAPVDPCDPEAVLELARERAIGLVVVGPEAPLVAGVADALESAGVQLLRGIRVDGGRPPRRLPKALPSGAAPPVKRPAAPPPTLPG